MADHEGVLRLAVLICLGALAIAIVAGPAFGATSTVTGNVNAGSLSLSTSATPSFSVTLDGTDKTGSYTVPATVTDATGAGAGWNLTITSTQFTTGAKTLATTASSLTGVTSTCATSCTSPTNAITYPIAVPAASSPPAAVKYFNAAATTGAGQFTNTPAISVAVPASTATGAYTSTLTLAAVSGP